jgi:PadR family transcriptional regulator, regulatory protein PadR
MQSEVLKGHVDALVLAALECSPGHGYAIVETVRTRSEGAFRLAEGTVYPALYRLEKRGLLESDWADGTGAPRRRVYRLTRRGEIELAELRRGWKSYVRAMEVALA